MNMQPLQVPSVLPRMIPVPSVKEGEKSFILSGADY